MDKQGQVKHIQWKDVIHMANVLSFLNKYKKNYINYKKFFIENDAERGIIPRSIEEIF